MSLNRHNPVRDLNELEIISAFLERGWRVQRLSGAGVPDLLIKSPSDGQLYVVEVKSPKGSLTAIQALWWDAWGEKPVIVRTVEDVEVFHQGFGTCE